MQRHLANTPLLVGTLIVVTTIAATRGAHAQDAQDTWSLYFRQGADVMSIPPAGQPGADFFRQGADLTSVPAPGQPGAEHYSNGAQANGADAWSVPRPGQPGAEIFHRGADATSVYRYGQGSTRDYFNRGADVTSAPARGEPGAELFTRGADVTSVPRPGQPGAEIFSHGADVMSVERARPLPEANTADDAQPPREDEPTNDTTEDDALDSTETALDLEGVDAGDEASAGPIEPQDDTPSDGIVSLLPAWPAVIDARPAVADPSMYAAPRSELAHQEAANDPRETSSTRPTGVDHKLSHLVFGARVVVTAVVVSLAILAMMAWRALKQRHE